MLAKSFTLTGIGKTLHQGLSKHGSTAHRTGQTGIVRHFYNGGNAASSFTNHNAPRLFKFDLRAGVATIAHFVF
ncbi:hypothetical protein D3C71_1590780 [compost metagenome]